ncbi:type II secretion system F family protein [Angustibacter peucedani]
MTGLGLGLLLGTGLFCVWWSAWPAAVREPAPRRRSRLADDLVRAGLPDVGVRPVVVASLVCGAVAGLLLLATTRVPAIAACFALMAATAPVALVRSRARRRRAALREVWPDVVDNLTSAVRAGLSLPEALSQLAVRGPEELRPAFAAFALDHRASGRFPEALDGLKARLADPVGDRVVESLRLAREVGGSDLGRLLRTLSTFLREDARTRSELESRQGWTVNAARLAVAAPWVVLLLLATRPESVAAYDQPAGVVVLVGGGAVTVVAYRVMLRIARLPDEQRVLR